MLVDYGYKFDKLKGLIKESNHAFVAPLSNPDETVNDVFIAFEKLFEEGKNPDLHFYCFEHEGIPVSYIVKTAYKMNNVIAIGPMYVARSARHKGLGKRQVEEFLDRAQRQGYEGVFTKTWLTNGVSRTIFESLGFKALPNIKCDRVNGESTIKYLLVFNGEFFDEIASSIS